MQDHIILVYQLQDRIIHINVYLNQKTFKILIPTIQKKKLTSTEPVANADWHHNSLLELFWAPLTLKSIHKQTMNVNLKECYDLYKAPIPYLEGENPLWHVTRTSYFKQLWT